MSDRLFVAVTFSDGYEVIGAHATELGALRAGVDSSWGDFDIAIVDGPAFPSTSVQWRDAIDRYKAEREDL